MKMTIRDIPDWEGKRALVREDFNVPLNQEGQITDDTRIREALPTLRYLADAGAKIVILSHLGRPKGKPTPEFSLAPVAKRLQELLPDLRVQFSSAPITEATVQLTKDLMPKDILLLENIRFEPGEEMNDPELAKRLATLGDVYVNDAFGAAHRAHASTEGVGHFLNPRVAGLLMEKEIKALSLVLSSKEPLTAIIGGSKISTKITVLENLLPRVQHMIIGGGMLFTFLKAKGYSIGSSLVEEEYIATARQLMDRAMETGKRIVLAEDVVIADRFAADAESRVVPVESIPDGWMGLDIGPESTHQIEQILRDSPLVLWNGPLGVFEFPKFSKGTQTVAETLGNLTEQDSCKSILGGGDTVAAIEQFRIDPKCYTHVSTGGGASLEFLEGKTLPGIAILDEATVQSGI